MRPKWNAPAAAACALVVATCGACGAGGGPKDAPAADLAGESFALPDGATLEALAAAPLAARPPMPAWAVTGTVDVPVGKGPVAVAVNTKTNKIYVANNRADSVTVIDGKTNKTTTVKVGPEPVWIAINEKTDKIYIANQKGRSKDGSVDPNGNGSVTVIDGKTNNTTTVAAGLEPTTVAINDITNKIYVADQGSNELTVIDGKTNKSKNWPLRPANPKSIYDGVLSPQDVRVNQFTNKIYVTGPQSNTLAVVDGRTNKYITVLTEGLKPVEGAPTDVKATSQTGLTPTGSTIDRKRNLIYTANFTSNDVTVIDGKTNKANVIPLVDVQDPYTIKVNATTNKIYVANLTSRSITVIDGATKKAITIGDLPGKPHDVSIDEKNNKIYFPMFVLYRGAAVGDDKQITGLILELDGATNKTTTIVAGTTPYAVATNPNTKKTYVANQDSGTVTVLTQR